MAISGHENDQPSKDWEKSQKHWKKGAKKNTAMKRSNSRKQVESKSKQQSKVLMDNGQKEDQHSKNSAVVFSANSSGQGCHKSICQPSTSLERQKSHGTRGEKGRLVHFVDGTLNGRKESMIFDSGARHSMLSRRLAQDLVSWREIRPTSAKPRAIDGSFFSLDGEVVIALSVGKVAVKQVFLISLDVAPGADVLLGTDFLREREGGQSRLLYCWYISRQQQHDKPAWLPRQVFGSFQEDISPARRNFPSSRKRVGHGDNRCGAPMSALKPDGKMFPSPKKRITFQELCGHPVDRVVG